MGQAIVRDAGATCVEVSASGDGLRIWGRADVRQGRKIRSPRRYGRGDLRDRPIHRMPGRRHGNAPSILVDVSAVIRALGL